MKILKTPISEADIDTLSVGDMVLITGSVFCGRDAVLPKVQQALRDGTLSGLGIDLTGGVIFHTAVSVAGVGPTSSNKLEIESSIGPLSEAGVKLHLGKGALSRATVEALDRFHSVYAVIPPVTALLGDKTASQRLAAFPELGMEALYELQSEGYPAIIAAAHGRSIYDQEAEV